MKDTLPDVHHSAFIIPHSSSVSHSRRLVLLAVLRVFARDEGAGARVLLEKSERVAQDSALEFAHAGAAQAVADLESFGVERARRAHLRRDFGADGDENRRDAAHLYLTLYRDDRAVAHVRSTARQDDNVGARTSVNLVRDFGRCALVHRLELHRVAHVADMFFGDVAYEAFPL